MNNGTRMACTKPVSRPAVMGVAPSPSPRRLRWRGGALLAFALWLSGCGQAPVAPAPVAPPPAVVQAEAAVRSALAPTGVLRVGVYPGSPSSLVTLPGGQRAGVALDLGQVLGRELGVPVQVVEFARVALVVDALKAGQIDFTFTNASESRARDVDFTAPLVRVELGYLVPAGSKISRVEEIDQAGVRVGVTEGSTSQGVLGRQYRQASLVGAPSMEAARTMLAQGRIEAFATNKAILHELADAVPGSRILDGRWGLEHMAIAVPKGREAGRAWLAGFAMRVGADGRLAAIVERAGLRGTAKD